MTRLAVFLRRVGSADAVSWPVFWTTLVAGSLGNFVSNNEGPLITRLAALAAGQAVLWGPLLLVGFALRRAPERPRPLLVLSVAGAGLTARAVVIGFMFSALLGRDQALWGDRFAGAVFNVGLAFVVSAYVVSALRERRRQIAELVALERGLSDVVEQAGREFADRNAEAVAQVQAVLEQQLNLLDPADARRSRDVLQSTALDIVRPLSHELAKSRPGDEPPGGASAVKAKVSWPDVLDHAATGTPFLPGLTTLVICFELVAATVAYPDGAVAFVGLAAVMWLLVRIANALLRRWLPGRARGARLAVVMATAVSIGLVMAALMLVGVQQAPMVEGLALGAFLFAAVVTPGLGIAASFARDRERIVQDLQQSSRALQRRLVRWRQVQWMQQKALSRALHGPVQTAVTVGALQLDAVIRSGEVSEGSVEQVRDSLRAALRGIDTSDSSIAPLAEVLARIVSTWEGLCTVSTEVDEATVEPLARNAALRSCVIDIATDAISNAVRHGGATSVSVKVQLADTAGEDLQLVIASDSRLQRPPGSRGLGTLLLDECTLDWRLDEAPTGLVLVARLPSEV